MWVLHNLHRNSKGIQVFIFNLKESRFSDCFSSTGIKSYFFGPKNYSDLVAWYTNCTWRPSKVPLLTSSTKNLLWTQMFLLEFLDTNLLNILNISVAKTCKFLWCIKTRLSLFNSSENVDKVLDNSRNVRAFLNKIGTIFYDNLVSGKSPPVNSPASRVRLRVG